MRNDNVVYVVHCIDTEGPLYESIEATFDRINEIFGFDFKASKETLHRLQNKSIDLNGKEDAVYNVVAPERINTNDTWDKIDKMLDYITKDIFRMKYPDSFNNGWVYNWFCLDHVGFTGENPRRRDIGFHNIFDHYKLYNKLNGNDQDMIQWHYHPLPIVKDAHRSGTTYLSSSNIYEILARKIIDRKWFPSAFRPGFHTERPDSHWFLEQWIPFDYSNQACERTNDQPDLNHGRFGDWRRAPKSWIPYNPSYEDYQRKGNCNRFIARCLNMESRIREITKDDIRKAFKEAEKNGSSLLSFTNHDFRNMKIEILKIAEMITEVSKEFKKVKFSYSDAVNAIRKVKKLNDINPPNFNLEIDKYNNKSTLKIQAENDIFGPQPFLALKTFEGRYYWENFDFQGNNKWSYTFDFNTIDINAIQELGVAANTQSGVTEVIVYDLIKDELQKEILNY